MLGGFDTSLNVGEDNDLTRKVMLENDAAVTSCLVSSYTIEMTQSSLPRDLDRYSSRISRQKILDQKGVFQRLIDLAHSDYWLGRIARMYLGSMVIHLQGGQFIQAMGKLFFVLRSILHANVNIFSVVFWQSLFHRYESPTFSKGFQLENRNSAVSLTPPSAEGEPH